MANFGPLMAEIGLPVWGTPENFNRFRLFDFITAATSLTGDQPNFARSLAVSWVGTLYIHFWGLLPLTEFCYVQNSLCVQALRSRTLAVHDTPAAASAQLCGVVQGMELRNFRKGRGWSPPIFGWAAITLGIGPHSS